MKKHRIDTFDSLTENSTDAIYICYPNNLKSFANFTLRTKMKKHRIDNQKSQRIQKKIPNVIYI